MSDKKKAQAYTGEIAAQAVDPPREYSSAEQEISFGAEKHAIWTELYDGIFQPHFMEHVCREYLEGFDLLKLDRERIPTIAHLNQQITPRTGWRVERTVVRYTLADDWYKKFAERIFLVTDYLRTRDQMEFTPEPDMFHDIFGHLPFLTMDFYARIEDKFAPAYLKATPEEREVIKRLAWYSTEFGLVMEGNRFKIFGAGIISGRAEYANTVMEFYRLNRDSVIDFNGDVFAQLQGVFRAHRGDVLRIIEGVNDLHQKGEMSSQDQGWNVVGALCERLEISRSGYFGGEVILAPFEVEMIARIPKTVYAFNPMFFVCDSFDQMEDLLDSYLKPIAERE